MLNRMTVPHAHGHLRQNARQLLVAGHYGFGNVGDEAILAAILEHLDASIPGVCPVVVSGDPAATAQLHGVRSIHWTDVASIVAEAEECDAILLGGGGLFHDYWSFDPSSILTQDYSGIAYFASFPLLGAILGVPVVIVSVGVGPLLTAAGKETTRLAFEDASYVSVRDTASKKVLGEIGVDGSRVTVVADPAFALKPKPSSLDAATADVLAALPRPIVGVALRSWNVQGNDSGELARAAAGALDRFVDTYGGSILFFSFQREKNAAGDDATFAESVRHAMRFAASNTVVSEANHPLQIAAMIERLDLMLTMRLHSVILALKAHVPFAAIVYDPKVRGVVDEVGCGDYAVEVSTASAGILYDRLTAAFAQKDLFKGEIARRVAALGEDADKWLAGIPAFLARAREDRDHASTSAGRRALGALAAASTRMVAAREETARLVARAQALVEQVAERQAAIERIATEAAGLAARNRGLEQKVAELQEALARIHGSRLWRFASLYWRLLRGIGFLPRAEKPLEDPARPR